MTTKRQVFLLFVRSSRATAAIFFPFCTSCFILCCYCSITTILTSKWMTDHHLAWLLWVCIGHGGSTAIGRVMVCHQCILSMNREIRVMMILRHIPVVHIQALHHNRYYWVWIGIEATHVHHLISEAGDRWRCMHELGLQEGHDGYYYTDLDPLPSIRLVLIVPFAMAALLSLYS